MFKELAGTLGEADAPLVVAGVPISNRDEYLVNPRLSVSARHQRAPFCCTSPLLVDPRLSVGAQTPGGAAPRAAPCPFRSAPALREQVLLLFR